jgi:hypothetical protein
MDGQRSSVPTQVLPDDNLGMYTIIFHGSVGIPRLPSASMTTDDYHLPSDVLGRMHSPLRLYTYSRQGRTSHMKALHAGCFRAACMGIFHYRPEDCPAHALCHHQSAF